jgi:hypothetical protein
MYPGRLLTLLLYDNRFILFAFLPVHRLASTHVTEVDDTLSSAPWAHRRHIFPIPCALLMSDMIHLPHIGATYASRLPYAINFGFSFKFLLDFQDWRTHSVTGMYHVINSTSTFSILQISVHGLKICWKCIVSVAESIVKLWYVIYSMGLKEKS